MNMPVMEWMWSLQGALSLVLGAGLGFFGGLFGIGGGVMAIPLLVLAYGMEQPLAQGTALVMMVPNLLIGWWRYSRVHPAPWHTVVAIGGMASVTTWGVAHWATGLSPDTLRAIFSLFLGCLAWHMLKQTRKTPPVDAIADSPGKGALSPRYIPLVGLVGGSSMGLLGIGGGLVATPILSGWFGQRQAMAQSLALALVAPSSVIALGTYAQAERVNWSMGVPMALAGMLTVSSGVALATRLPERTMRRAFAWMLLATSGWLLVWPWARMTA